MCISIFVRFFDPRLVPPHPSPLTRGEGGTIRHAQVDHFHLSSFVRLFDPRSIPPHPGPLPRGEGGTLPYAQVDQFHFSRVRSPPITRSRCPFSVRNSRAPSSHNESAPPAIFRIAMRM